MSGGRPWTTGEVRRLHDMRARRFKTADIAAALGRTEYAIFSFLRYVPATRERPAAMKATDRLPKLEKPKRDIEWTADETSRLRELAADGATIKDVSDALGRSLSAVRCKASNLDIRFANKGGNSIYRLDQEYNHFKKNAVEGSAKLLDAMLRLTA